MFYTLRLSLFFVGLVFCSCRGMNQSNEGSSDIFAQPESSTQEHHLCQNYIDTWAQAIKKALDADQIFPDEVCIGFAQNFAYFVKEVYGESYCLEALTQGALAALELVEVSEEYRNIIITTFVKQFPVVDLQALHVEGPKIEQQDPEIEQVESPSLVLF